MLELGSALPSIMQNDGIMGSTPPRFGHSMFITKSSFEGKSGMASNLGLLSLGAVFLGLFARVALIIGRGASPLG